MKTFIEFIQEGIVYDTTKKRKNGGINIAAINKMDPHEQYLKHYANHLLLHKLSKNASLGDKFDIEKEMETARNKMKFWSQKSNFNPNKIVNQAHALKKHFDK